MSGITQVIRSGFVVDWRVLVVDVDQKCAVETRRLLPRFLSAVIMFQMTQFGALFSTLLFYFSSGFQELCISGLLRVDVWLNSVLLMILKPRIHDASLFPDDEHLSGDFYAPEGRPALGICCVPIAIQR